MKTITFLLLLCLSFSFSIAQEKGQLGVYTEGGWYTPKDSPGNSMKDGIAAGIGMYYEFPIHNRFFGSLGVGYRYKQNQKYQVEYSYFGDEYGGYGYSTYGYSPYGYSPYGSNTSAGEWLNFPQHYIVLPAKLKYRLKNNFFVQSGLEASWLLNYDYVSVKPEFNWSLGLGSKIGDLEWSLNYVRGTKMQGMLNYTNVPDVPIEITKDQGLRNRMLMLNLLYPLWKR
ncbi:hypothetical protein ACUNWD_16155 [Sunxiuqinia sp. A32]|uniref:hypothetical protein n=1 Tax=Sunxiuqinia sp. A32 TaxID=3461496 RepID=UPI0040456ADE